ncbi:MAG: hypothetical protein B6U69_00120 [Thermofilum sp. ex4484_15]|nr:MAG: hypothetical protein B6U69_00120 [Thermofilum sp. ex4484_15]
MSLPLPKPSGSMASFLLYVFTFWVALYLVKLTPLGMKLEKKGITIDFLLLLIRTKRLNSFIEKIGEGYRRFWDKFFYISSFLSIILMAFGIWFFHVNTIHFFSRSKAYVPVQPIIPGFNIGLNSLPYLLVALAIVLISHELAHGIAASAEGIPLSSAGLLLLFILPGGFVEPSENEFNKASFKVKFKVLAAGSVANLYVGLLTILLLTSLFSPAGVIVVRTVSGSPAQAHLMANDIIIGIDSSTVNSINDIIKALNKFQPGQFITLRIRRGASLLKIKLKLGRHPRDPTRPFIGIEMSNYYDFKFFRGVIPVPLTSFISNVMVWTINLCLTVAVVNMLPTYLVDGGKIISEVIRRFVKGKLARALELTLFSYMAIIFILNIGPAFLYMQRWRP